MSFLSKIKGNQPKANLEEYFLTLYGKSKAGKTTFIRDLIEERYDGDFSKAVLLGAEVGYKTLTGIHALSITGFDYPEVMRDDDEDADEEDAQYGFIEVIDELIENKRDLSYRLVVIDTLTALERYANKYVVERQSIEDGKMYSSVGDIPWGRGYDAVAEAIYEQIDRLKKNGFGVIVICHDKQKTKKTQANEEYNYTTINANGKVADIIFKEADLIIYADLVISKDGEGNVKTDRRLLFRSNGDVECGARFKNVPEYTDFTPVAFIEAFENAVLSAYDNDEDAVKAKIEEENKHAEMKREEDVTLPATPKELIDELMELQKSHFNEGDKKKELLSLCKEHLGMANYTKSEDIVALQLVIDKLKEMM